MQSKQSTGAYRISPTMSSRLSLMQPTTSGRALPVTLIDLLRQGFSRQDGMKRLAGNSRDGTRQAG